MKFQRIKLAMFKRFIGLMMLMGMAAGRLCAIGSRNRRHAQQLQPPQLPRRPLPLRRLARFTRTPIF